MPPVYAHSAISCIGTRREVWETPKAAPEPPIDLKTQHAKVEAETPKDTAAPDFHKPIGATVVLTLAQDSRRREFRLERPAMSPVFSSCHGVFLARSIMPLLQRTPRLSDLLMFPEPPRDDHRHTERCEILAASQSQAVSGRL